MRTTLVLDDQIFRQAKREAGETGTTLSALVNAALRTHLGRRRAPDNGGAAFVMPVFGGSDTVHLTPAELAGLRDEGR
jgi:hypothetical protein